jgi:hypothetical protein
MTVRSLLESPQARLNAYIFLALMAAFSAFAGPLNNTNTFSRMGLTANFVQHGRIDIDGYEHLTLDRAKWGEHYYSDKAPGMTFLALPPAYLFTRVVPVSGDIDWADGHRNTRNFLLLVYICTVLTSGLLTAVAGVMLFAHVREETGRWAPAAVATLAYALATPTWAWATAFFGHAAAGATLVIGFILFEKAARHAPSKRRVWLAVGAGVSLGAAVSIEFTAAIAVAIIMVYGGFILLRRDQKFMPAFITVTVAAGVAALMQAPLLIYNAAAFGSPFKLGYSNLVGWEGMKTGIFGIGMPDIRILGEILFGEYRGILWISPIVALALAAVILLALRRGEGLRGGAILLIVAFYLAMNAGYYYWHGGYSTGPRHITPIYPFLGMALALWFAHAGKAWRSIILMALAVSVALNLMVVSVNTIAPDDVAAPMRSIILPEFFAGQLDQSMVRIVTGWQGLSQLLPLFAVWGVLGWLASREFWRMQTSASHGNVSQQPA